MLTILKTEILPCHSMMKTIQHACQIEKWPSMGRNTSVLEDRIKTST